jgi:serine/threonine protein kinase
MAATLESRLVSSGRYAAGDSIAAKYRLERVLGIGGMGEVWRAINVELDAPVAIKLMRADLDRTQLAQRLKQEARAAAKLAHPAIVRTFDVGETELGDPFIVMELLTGRSLAAQLAAEGRLSAAHAVQLLLPVADALSVAHGKGIVHRDLKPDNIFIAIDNEQVQPKLVDFGIAKMFDREHEPIHLTQAGTVLGSPEYMSPEQARGHEDVDLRSDVWSFCVVLYETIAGKGPFTGANYNALLRSIVEDEPPSILDRLAGDDRLSEIIQRGLSKQRELRFQSMTELGCSLAAWLISQGVLEDACGSSLDARWIARASDPLAIRASRASLASLATLPPPSGVRPAERSFGAAPTVDAAALKSVDSESVSEKPAQLWLSLPRALLFGGAFAVLVVTWLGARQARPIETTPQLAEPLNAPLTGAAGSITPSPAAPPSPAVPAVVEVTPPELANATTPSKHTTHSAAVAPHATRISVVGKLTSGAAAPKASLNNSSHDLISPY